MCIYINISYIYNYIYIHPSSHICISCSIFEVVIMHVAAPVYLCACTLRVKIKLWLLHACSIVLKQIQHSCTQDTIRLLRSMSRKCCLHACAHTHICTHIHPCTYSFMLWFRSTSRSHTFWIHIHMHVQKKHVHILFTYTHSETYIHIYICINMYIYIYAWYIWFSMHRVAFVFTCI
jgi:hypothetical protein